MAESVKFTIAAIKEEKSGATNIKIISSPKSSARSSSSKAKPRATDARRNAPTDISTKAAASTKLKPGLYNYTFKTALPATYDRNATHVVGGESTARKRPTSRLISLLRIHPIRRQSQNHPVGHRYRLMQHLPRSPQGARRSAARSRLLRTLSHLATYRSRERGEPRFKSFSSQNPSRQATAERA